MGSFLGSFWSSLFLERGIEDEKGWAKRDGRGGSSQCRTRGGGGGVEGSDGLAKEGWPEHCDGVKG